MLVRTGWTLEFPSCLLLCIVGLLYIVVHCCFQHEPKLTGNLVAFFEYNIDQLNRNVGDTIADIDDVLSGRLRPLADAYMGIFRDDRNFRSRLRRSQRHLIRAKRVLSQGMFNGDDRAWYRTGRANDGVVSVFSLSFYGISQQTRT